MPASRVLVMAPHGSYRTAAFVAAARRLGVEVLIASEGRHSIVSDYARGLHIDFADEAAALDSIRQAATRTPFAGIVGTDDSTVELAARSAAVLGLPHNPPAAVRYGRRKDQARACLQAAGLNVPVHRRLDLDAPLSPQLADLEYPVVVKPVSLSASRGVIRADHETALRQAIDRIRVMLRHEKPADPELTRWLLIEEYIPGQEVALEGMLHAGNLDVLAVFDKPDPLEGPCFEETYYTTPSRHPGAVLAELERQVQAACAAYGLREGPVHAECRINDQGVWIIEVAARSIGGLCGRLLRFGTGYSLEELVLAQAMGKRLPAGDPDGGAGVLMIPIPQAGILKRIEGLLDARRVPGIESIDIQIREGHELVPLPEGNSYLGFLFARADTPAEAEAALREAHACLNIVVAPLWKARVA
ncbi:MAG TPA: ATP-grasp domain-containing protein [Chromatiales bacterium]|nr:ATP-grasp domain-containing protein [Chromatiales bacterium]